MDECICEYGEEVVFEVGVYIFYLDLIKIIGCLRFRISYG